MGEIKSDERSPAGAGWLATATGRLFASLLLTAPLFLLSRLLVPGVDADAIRRIVSTAGARSSMASLSVVALGITPFLTAYPLIELLALAVPRLRWRRVSGSWPRRPLTIASLLLGGVLALIQAYFIAVWIESSSSNFTFMLVTRESWAFRGPAMLALLAGTAVLVGCAHAIRRWGLGNGYSWLLAAGSGGVLLEQCLRARDLFVLDRATPADGLLTAAVLAALAWGCYRLSRVALSPEVQIGDGLRLQPLVPSSGVAPLMVASSLLLVPRQLANLGLPLQSIAGALVPGSVAYLVAHLVLLAGAGLLLSLAFYPPAVVLRFFEELGRRAAVAVNGTRAELSAPLRRSAIHSVAVLAAIPLVLHYVGPRLLVTSFVEAIVLFMVAIDLHREWRSRRADPSLTAAWELHRLYAVAPIRELLERRGIPTTVRGLQHRRLLFFFAPYVPVELLVPAARADEAAALIAEWSGLEAVEEPPASGAG